MYQSKITETEIATVINTVYFKIHSINLSVTNFNSFAMLTKQNQKTEFKGNQNLKVIDAFTK